LGSLPIPPGTLELRSRTDALRHPAYIGNAVAGPIHVSQAISPTAASPGATTLARGHSQRSRRRSGFTAGGAITLTNSNNDASAFAAKATAGNIAYADRNNVMLAVSSVQARRDNGSVSLRRSAAIFSE
jgi:hypothetical protein